jgi:hypothetical protein
MKLKTQLPATGDRVALACNRKTLRSSARVQRLQRARFAAAANAIFTHELACYNASCKTFSGKLQAANIDGVWTRCWAR